MLDFEQQPIIAEDTGKPLDDLMQTIAEFAERLVGPEHAVAA